MTPQELVEPCEKKDLSLEAISPIVKSILGRMSFL